MKKGRHKIEETYLKNPVHVFPVLDRRANMQNLLGFSVKSSMFNYVWIEMHVCAKTLRVAPGLANAWPLGSTKFANTSQSPGMTRRVKCPAQLPGRCMGTIPEMTEPRDLGRQWKIKDHYQSLSTNLKKCNSFLWRIFPNISAQNWQISECCYDCYYSS